MKKILSEDWLFHQAGQKLNYPAFVPGTVHTDLLANGIIEDPYYRTNEKDQQWIDKVDWEYWIDFHVGKEWLDKDIIHLNFKGLDTYADVYLNDQLILEANNFFLSYKIDVKGIIVEGQNHLRIYFHSPIKVGLRELADYGFLLPADNDQAPNGGMGQQRVSVFMRKPGYHFGWDWGPRLVPTGIWNDVYLTAHDKSKLDNIWVRQDELSDDLARLNAIMSLQTEVAGDYLVQIWNDNKLLKEDRQALDSGIQRWELPFEIENPKLWWTQELGEPHLYEFEIRLLHDGVLVDSQKQSIGLRTIKLIQEEDKKGSSFAFELNGVRVFAKGANYIPNDIFIPRVSDQAYENVIEGAVKANMNMLRVWGGGFYEKDIFYDLCDQKGILVWQDFMFACSMYPGYPSYLDKIRAEAEENVRRLRHHPCIALWCGNNEMDIAWSQYDEKGGWGWKQRYTKERRAKIWKAYDTIFHHLLPNIVQTHHPEMAYWPSSPYAKEGTHSSDDATHGDIHYWGVWHGQHPFSDFKNNVGRFMSEYGFQSFPEFKTVKSYAIPQDYDIESEVMASHQRSGIGNLRIRSYMEQHYKVPKDFEQLLYVGQLLQAEGIRQAIEAHRGAMPYCMGTLYWQINDCWQVASWSSMDYFQRWKALHYQVRQSFEPFILIVETDKKNLVVKGVSDLLERREGTLRLKLFDFQGMLLEEKSQMVSQGAQTVSNLYADKLKAWKPKPEASFLQIEFMYEGQILAQKIHYFHSPKDLYLPKLRNSPLRKLEKEGGTFLLTMRSKVLVKNVFLETDAEGWFEDNYMDLLPGEERKIRFYPKDSGLRLKKKHVRIRCLND